MSSRWTSQATFSITITAPDLPDASAGAAIPGSPKKKFSKKKEFSEEEAKEVKIAKANSRTKTVKPAYKKKMRWEVEKVKNRYRRKAIQKSINRSRARKLAESARKNDD